MPSAAPSEIVSLPPPDVDAPPEWRAIIERALAKHVDDRFQDARSLLSAIRALDPSAPSSSVDVTAKA
jgi:hypothetical protein